MCMSPGVFNQNSAKLARIQMVMHARIGACFLKSEYIFNYYVGFKQCYTPHIRAWFSDFWILLVWSPRKTGSYFACNRSWQLEPHSCSSQIYIPHWDYFPNIYVNRRYKLIPRHLHTPAKAMMRLFLIYHAHSEVTLYHIYEKTPNWQVESHCWKTFV